MALGVATFFTVPVWSASIGILVGMAAALLYKHAKFLREDHHTTTDEVVAHASSEKRMNSEADIKQIWTLIDSDKDNALSKEEVAIFVAEIGLSVSCNH